ncbi:hypothetical protein B1K96_31500 [Escherichia coli]|nr:hypothetical protein B1K96_31500 [Escherichia coli]
MTNGTTERKEKREKKERGRGREKGREKRGREKEERGGKRKKRREEGSEDGVSFESTESVEEIVLQQIMEIDSPMFDKNLLIQIYRSL